MTVKEKVLNEIESLPDEQLEQVRRYIEAVKAEAAKRRRRSVYSEIQSIPYSRPRRISRNFLWC